MSENLLLIGVLVVGVTGCAAWLLGAVLALVGVSRLLVRAVRHLAGRPAAGLCPCGGDVETCSCGTGKPLPQPRPYAGGAW
ncbi:hypothetical protein LHJ74_14465 [Streptomyces sp. N2-109]|uniref:FeoB-associated Cys-rich membrane protein n=1 Tax=Streptomyces gossypii TaxID=2883101 RepID=A0ABT2JTA0_9ACTN|nr:hypothetical protein [Streptomyces gossypii]MCT2591097.1 hypothetical protein [Streptomyces gossypii]